MIVISGPSASGKTEVAKTLATKYGITKVITTTTRPIRVNEVNGRDYFFVSVEKFKEMIEENKFVEYTCYNGNYYGSTKDQIADDKCIVIESNGLKAYLALDNSKVISFMLRSDKETRYKRMISRGDKHEDAIKRLSNDVVDFNDSIMNSGNYLIDSETKTVEQVADEIYSLYIKHIKG